jgi:hypothetical protein
MGLRVAAVAALGVVLLAGCAQSGGGAAQTALAGYQRSTCPAATGLCIAAWRSPDGSTLTVERYPGDGNVLAASAVWNKKPVRTVTTMIGGTERQGTVVGDDAELGVIMSGYSLVATSSKPRALPALTAAIDASAQ